MKRVIYLVILSIIIYSCQKLELLEHSNPLEDGRPFVSTIKSDFITSTTAELSGEVISTGETHTVKDFVKLAFELVGLDWKKYVRIDKKFFRPTEVSYLRGDHSKATKKLKWKPKIKFKQLVKLMLNEDIKRWTKFLDGKIFPWDAPLYPNESKLITRLSEKNAKMRSIKRKRI